MKKLACNILQYYTRYFPIRKGKIPLLGLFEKLGLYEHMTLTTVMASHTRVRLRIDDWVQRLVYFFGVYEFEKEESYLWMDYARKSEYILDIGSNFGYYSLLACDVNPNCKILAFEPAPEMFAVLQHNLRLNQYDNVKALNIGLSDRIGRFDFFVADAKHTGMSGLSMPDGVGGQKIEVDISTVDSILKEHISFKPGLIKIDVEGNELNVLFGMKSLLVDSRPVFFIEIYEQNLIKFGHHSSQVFDFFHERGYTIHEFIQNQGLVQVNFAKDIGLAICIPK
ncbi:MAG: hypothetical protein RLZ10_1185 [Bacteroidota bacterium]|jgi:FkbM family methyltransferase